jgi:hypothetical protein
MKKIYLFLLALLPLTASADDSGTTGQVKWTWVESTKTLTISGTGYMGEYGYFPEDDVESFSDAPWANYKEKIQTVIIKSGVTNIGGGAFHEYTNLKSVTVPSSVTYFGRCAFSDCSSLSSINIPDGVQGIGLGAFGRCNSLTAITIPSSVIFIEVNKYSNPFVDCGGLTSIKVESGNSNYDSRNDCNAIIRKEDNALIAGCKNTIIPNTVSSIAPSAFSGRINMTSITIPNSVTSIGLNAFGYCSGLTSVTIEGDKFSIGDYAFQNCSKLTDIYFTGLVDCTFNIIHPYYMDNYYSNVTVHVPSAFLAKYPTAFFEYGESLFGFKDLKTLDGSSIPKCEKPVISYANGKLSFTSATPGAEFHWTITSANGEEGSGVSQEVNPSFTVSVYAAKTGCVNSDIEIRQFDCNTGGLKGDVDGNGVVNVADHVKLSAIIFGK